MWSVLDAIGSLEIMGPVWKLLRLVEWVTPVELSLFLPRILNPYVQQLLNL